MTQSLVGSSTLQHVCAHAQTASPTTNYPESSHTWSGIGRQDLKSKMRDVGTTGRAGWTGRDLAGHGGTMAGHGGTWRDNGGTWRDNGGTRFVPWRDPGGTMAGQWQDNIGP